MRFTVVEDIGHAGVSLGPYTEELGHEFIILDPVRHRRCLGVGLFAGTAMGVDRHYRRGDRAL